ncbi:MAG: hypothetical protein Q9163_004157 [Psora crenata]
MATRAPLVVPALSKHTATVIWAHGLGDSGAGWKPIIENWRLRRRFPECKFIFPNAPIIPITVVRVQIEMFPGPIIDSVTELWYADAWVTTFDSLAQAHDEPGILRSRDYFNSLIKAEVDQGIASTRIVIGGFSQGAAIAIFTGITSPLRLGGIVGLSSYLLLHDQIKDYATTEPSNKATPIFMGHGDCDPLIQYQWGVQTAKLLREMGWNVDFRTYKGLAHSAEPKEIDDLEKYLEGRLPSTC